MGSGGSMLGQGAQAPKFLIGSIVISLSRCCLPNDEGPAPPQMFFLEPPLQVMGIGFLSLQGRCRAVNRLDHRVSCR